MQTVGRLFPVQQKEKMDYYFQLVDKSGNAGDFDKTIEVVRLSRAILILEAAQHRKNLTAFGVGGLAFLAGFGVGWLVFVR